jgi:hypothetical protein
LVHPVPQFARITAAVFQRTISQAGRGPIRGPDRERNGHSGVLSAELVIPRFVGEQSLLARSGSFDPLAENFASLDHPGG